MSTSQRNEYKSQEDSTELALNNNRNSISYLGLRRNSNQSHNPGDYENLQSDFYQDAKANHIRRLLLRNALVADLNRDKLKKEYRDAIMSAYQPMHLELYQINPTSFFVPSFLKAISENTEESFRDIISEPFPGILTFEMLEPEFCNILLDEVENIKNFIRETRSRIMRPNTMNEYGVVLDDFGMEIMLGNLMKDFILPMSTIFFPEVGGATLDSHHGYIVEYGTNRDDHLGFHVDDSEVTLNVCLGEQFSGGELFFRGVRCHNHINVESEPEEIYNYSHAPGRAVLHRGRHRHGALSTTSGHRVNMLLWCRSSVFREMRKYEKKAPSWCRVCQREKEERRHRYIAAMNLELQTLIAGGSTSSQADSTTSS